MTDSPSKIEQIFNKLDEIWDEVNAVKLAIATQDGAIKERIAVETATIRREFNEYKSSVAREFSDYRATVTAQMTANTVKVGVAFTVVMFILSGLIAFAFRSL